MENSKPNSNQARNLLKQEFSDLNRYSYRVKNQLWW